LALLVTSACRKAPAPSAGDSNASATTPDRKPWFNVQTSESGLDIAHVGWITRRYDFPEILAPGVCLLDYDEDGWLDVYLVQGGDVRAANNPLKNTLHRNLGNGEFEDVTSATGVGDSGFGMGCAVGDYDADGHVDLYVTNVGQNKLFRNTGQAVFEDVTAQVGMQDGTWSTSAAFVDLEADGDLDIVMANYVRWAPRNEIECFGRGNQRDYCQPNNYNAPARDDIYRNLGNGKFESASETLGTNAVFGNGLGVAVGDLNGDGFADFYIANDGNANQLWMWNTKSKKFTDQALLAGCALNREGIAEAGMGVASIDIDQDGDLDLFMSHLRGESNTLYKNHKGMFDDVTARVGLSSESYAFTGFGLGFADFNNDGSLDLFVANGRVKYEDPVFSSTDPYVDPNLLFAGRPDGSFKEVLPRGGTDPVILKTSRGAAFGDLNNDGGIDIVICNTHATPDVLFNTISTSHHWIMFDVRNAAGSPALGATVQIKTASATRSANVETAFSYCSANDHRVHFGLKGATTVTEVIINRPGAADHRSGPYAADKIHRIDLK
jgi:hypothetical protein